MRVTEQIKSIKGQVETVSVFLNALDSELATIVDELHEADESNALAVCRSVAEKLDKYYQQL